VTTAYVVGFSVDSGGREAVELGRMLAAGTDAVLHPCTVVPDRHLFETMPGVDLEYVSFLTERARAALDEAEAAVGGTVPVKRHVQPAASAADGLVELANTLGAEMIVLGSARGGLGRLVVGSTTNDLLHSAPLPVAMATSGFRAPAGSLARVTCGVVGGPGRAAAVQAAVRLATSHDAPLRLATLLVARQQMGQAGAGFDAERPLLAEWRAKVAALHDQVRAELGADLQVAPVIVEGGPSWRGTHGRRHSMRWAGRKRRSWWSVPAGTAGPTACSSAAMPTRSSVLRRCRSWPRRAVRTWSREG
jgi:nucleotide-binding universal stress UspA family protein